MTTPRLCLGLLGASPPEQARLIEHMQHATLSARGMCDFVSGQLWGIDCVCVMTRLGKVAAATTAAILIERFDVTHVLCTGVASAAADHVRVGDIMVAEQLVQHDIDASPLLTRCELSLTGQSWFVPDKFLSDLLEHSAKAFANNDFYNAITPDDRRSFQLERPQVHRGLVGSGGQFIQSGTRFNDLKGALAGMLAVEIEGAAVAHTCADLGVPFAVLRTICGHVNEDAPVNFAHFVDRVAAYYAVGIVKRLCLI
jgi:adenosylhomocysteine nucleosidase